MSKKVEMANSMTRDQFAQYLNNIANEVIDAIPQEDSSASEYAEMKDFLRTEFGELELIRIYSDDPDETFTKEYIASTADYVRGTIDGAIFVLSEILFHSADECEEDD